MDCTLIGGPDHVQQEADLIAALALRGFTVVVARDGYLVSRWGLTRHCPDLVTLTAFAKQVGVPQ